jgi:hypothetical protein
MFLWTIVLVSAISLPAYSQFWDVTITATSDDGTVTPHDRIFGVADGATDDFDPGIDLQLPDPPGGQLDLYTYFPCSNQVVTRLRIDRRGVADVADGEVWQYRLRADLTGGTLSWDASTVPTNTDIILEEPDGTKVDMKSQGSITYPVTDGEALYRIYTASGAGLVELVDQSPSLTWNYRLTAGNGAVISWTYTGDVITGASVDGSAHSAGWSVLSQTKKQVTFCTTTPFTDGQITGFHITGTVAGVGSWRAGGNSDVIEGSLPVGLSSLTGSVVGDAVRIAWQTHYEENTLGMNIYRCDKKEGQYAKVNSSLIPAAGVVTTTPRDYEYVDESVQRGKTYYYYLESVDIDGQRSRSDTIRVLVEKQYVTMQRFIPASSALYQNYPNPFNPETWIPYELAHPCDVVVRVHNFRGDLVRTLLMGHQEEGIYLSKSRSAYWDGRNDLGEQVVSGVYYYTLDAGDFTATRKMLILK